MIDWLTIEVGFDHPDRISGGMVASTKEDGTIHWETNKFKQVKGSHDSTVTVKTNGEVSGRTSSVLFSGNPSKFFQGHNLFGSDDLRAVSYGFVLGILEKMDIPRTDLIKRYMRQGLYAIKRVDCTLNFQMKSREHVRSWIRSAAKFASAKHQKTSSYSEKTLYFGQNSRRITLKIYCKGDEIKVHKLSDSIPQPIIESLKSYADSILRCEVTLRGRELQKRNLEYGIYWTDKHLPYKIVMERLKAIQLPENVFLDNFVIEGLKPRQQLAYNSWASGKDLRAIFSKPTFYRYRSELIPHGIDIACPSGKNRSMLDVPLRDVLETPPVGIPGWAIGTEFYYSPPLVREDIEQV